MPLRMPPRFSLNYDLTSSVNATLLSKLLMETKGYTTLFGELTYLFVILHRTDNTHAFTSFGNLHTHTHTHICFEHWSCTHWEVYLFLSPGHHKWTNTHQCTIHWMPVITQVVVDEPQLDGVNVDFHLDDQFCRK